MAYNRVFPVSLDFKILFLAVVYCISSWIGYHLAFSAPQNIPVWPAAGVSLAFLILLGRESWPGITFGAIITQVFFYWGIESLEPENIVIHILITVAGVTLQVLAGNFLYTKFIENQKKPFSFSKDAFRFMFIAIVVSMISTTFYTGALFANQLLMNKMILASWFSWGLSNAVSIMLFTPLILSWTSDLKLKFNKEKILEGILFVITIAAVMALYRVENLSETMERAFPFLVIPFLMWLSFRFSLNIALSVMVAVALYAIFRTINGNGPLFLPQVYNSTLLLQTFVGVISISSLIISTTVKERNTIQLELEKFNENLESKINIRTKALNEEIRIRTKAENKLRLSNRNLRKTNSELDNFVYSVSHDLRAPIASVLGLINLAQNERSKTMTSKYLELIEESAKQQDKFIRKILDQSRNSRLEVKKEKIHFEKIILETFNQLKFIDISEKITKSININQDKPFYSDPWRLKVIFNNLLSNSIRYKNGSPPNINIDISIEDNIDKIHINDNGTGIPKKHLRHVFKMFYRATDVNAGSGLGLYIVKETLDKLKGEIKLTSNEGEGTNVDLLIPSLN